ncbi:MAG: hypothetical protein JWM73_2617, partial [Solirubrobacterales bacterium]|nr:hypothetical protein [Solirubrobacterales bacterium]
MLPARRILAVAAAALLAPAAAHADAPSTYQVGIGTKSIAV